METAPPAALPDSWSPQEKWVWEQTCLGKIADFNDGSNFGGPLDVETATAWPGTRIITVEFLETVLFDQELQGKLTRNGVRISGAGFDSPLDLSNAVLKHPLELLNCHFRSAVTLTRLRSSHHISLAGSRLLATLSADSMDIAGDVSLGSQAHFLDVNLSNSDIRGQVDASDARIDGGLDLGSIRVRNGVYLSGGNFAEIDLVGSVIGGDVDLNRASSPDKVNMNGMKVSGNVFMGGKAGFGAIELTGADISGNLEMEEVAVNALADLNSLKVGDNILMSKSTIDELELTGAVIDGQLDMDGAVIKQTLRLNGAKVCDNIYMRSGARFSEIDLTNGVIDGQLIIADAKVAGTLTMNNARIGGDFLLQDQAEVADITMSGALISGQLNVDNASVTGKCDISNAKINRSAYFSNGAEISELDLHGALIGGELVLDRSRVTRALDLQEIRVENYLSMLNVGLAACDKVNLQHARFSAIHLSGTSLPSIDMTGTRIQGEFRLGIHGLASSWRGGAKLQLRNVECGALVDEEQSWPPAVELTGFTYTRLGGSRYGTRTEEGAADRPLEWFVNWLGRQQSYSPNPYEQLAQVLLKSGAKETAEGILYAGKRRERSAMPFGFLKIRSTLLYLSVGYGYRSISRISIWVTVFTLAGVLALSVADWTGTLDATISDDLGSQYFQSVSHRLSYSLDKFLPLIRLRDYQYSKIQLDGWIAWYFDIHQLMGYFLGSLLIAGVSGIAKK